MYFTLVNPDLPCQQNKLNQTHSQHKIITQLKPSSPFQTQHNTTRSKSSNWNPNLIYSSSHQSSTTSQMPLPTLFLELAKFFGAIASMVLFVIYPNFGFRTIDGFWVIFWKSITWFGMSFVDLVWILLFFGIFMGFDWIQVLGLKPKDPSLAKSWPLSSSSLCLNWMGKMGGELGIACWMTLDVGLSWGWSFASWV